MSYWILFISAFGAATLLPLQSEAVFLGLVYQAQHSALALLCVASIGNILGSCVNWWLGTQIERFQNRKWFPVSQLQMYKAQNIYQKYGIWSLLLSWMPIIGDPLTLLAGVMRTPFLLFLFIVSIAKTTRYIALYLIFLGFF